MQCPDCDSAKCFLIPWWETVSVQRVTAVDSVRFSTLSLRNF